MGLSYEKLSLYYIQTNTVVCIRLCYLVDDMYYKIILHTRINILHTTYRSS